MVLTTMKGNVFLKLVERTKKIIEILKKGDSMKKEEDICQEEDLIRDYVSGLLTENEKAEVRKKMKVDKGFAEEVKLIGQLKIAFMQRAFTEMPKHVPTAYKESRKNNTEIFTYDISNNVSIALISMKTLCENKNC